MRLTTSVLGIIPWAIRELPATAAPVPGTVTVVVGILLRAVRARAEAARGERKDSIPGALERGDAECGRRGDNVLSSSARVRVVFAGVSMSSPCVVPVTVPSSFLSFSFPSLSAAPCAVDAKGITWLSSSGVAAPKYLPR